MPFGHSGWANVMGVIVGTILLAIGLAVLLKRPAIVKGMTLLQDRTVRVGGRISDYPSSVTWLGAGLILVGTLMLVLGLLYDFSTG